MKKKPHHQNDTVSYEIWLPLRDWNGPAIRLRHIYRSQNADVKKPRHFHDAVFLEFGSPCK
ncbi:hypothetical protein, partial [Vibrio breoganii]|uniref:hypothetical protein n=1 Tax=Vibrio breoganii TaxID=553239 RepID=UPI001A7E121C